MSTFKDVLNQEKKIFVIFTSSLLNTKLRSSSVTDSSIVIIPTLTFRKNKSESQRIKKCFHIIICIKMFQSWMMKIWHTSRDYDLA